MEWLSQYWIWVVVGIGVVWLLSRSRRGGVMSCCSIRGTAHDGASDQGKAQSTHATRPPVKETAEHR
jgi:hypothetical protein